MNDAIADLSWRAYPAGLLMAGGLLAAACSGYRAVVRARQLRDPRRALAIMRGFRISIVCLALAAIGAAWLWQIGWLFGLALVIGGQELLESTVVIAALKNGLRDDAPPAAPPPERRRIDRSAVRAVQPAAAVSQRAMVVSRSGGPGIA